MPAQLASIQSLIIDMDGVLWRGAKPLPGVADFFDFIKARRLRFLVVTNNATRTAEFLVERLASMGVAISPTQILTSAKAAALYLRRELPEGSNVLVVGEEGLLQTLREAGFAAEYADSGKDGRPAAVVVGLDRQVTYRRLVAAASAIRAGALFIATNTDATIPAEQGLMPGAGAIVAAVQTSTSVTPIIMGKPYRPMFAAALDIVQTPPEQTAMLGDRLDTDIMGAHGAGLATILVLTGVTTPQEALASAVKADWTFPNLHELRRQWEAELERV